MFLGLAALEARRVSADPNSRGFAGNPPNLGTRPSNPFGTWETVLHKSCSQEGFL